jgi:hypothetical protein
MAAAEWVILKTRWCERVGTEAHLMERRVYPADMIPDIPAYRVTAFACSWGNECNLAGCPCRWAYTNPDYDPFEIWTATR